MRKSYIFILLLSVFFQGCANFDVVDLTTPLPSNGSKDGVAIHLNAKQRLVIAKPFGIVCAEPSPDALSAFAVSLGASTANPGKDAATLAAAFQTTAASIGLRTQSITLMRDALYRICEAYYGRALTGPAVMTLLAQSQNLTAAMLAIEQITGPVVANQVVLQGEAIVRSSASILQMQKLLDAARKDEEQKKTKLDEAQAESEKVTNEHKQKGEALNAKKADIENATVDGELPSDKQNLETERQKLKHDLGLLAQKKTTTETDLQKAQEAYKEAQKNRKELEANQDTVFVQSSATAKGEGKLSDTARDSALELEVKREVVKAVKWIVEKVLKKRYVVESCIALISDNPPKRSFFKDDSKTEHIDEKEADYQADYQDALQAWKGARTFCWKYLESQKPQ